MANRSKTLVEQCLCLDVKEYKLLKDGIYELKTTVFSLKFTKKDGFLFFSNNQTVEFLLQTVGYGERIMLQCPVCYEARRKLFMKSDSSRIACQKCHGLVYRTSRLSGNELEYVDNRIIQIRKQFDMTVAYDYGGIGFEFEYVPLHRPKYMRQEKFAALTNELKQLIDKRQSLWMSKLKL